MNPDPDMIDSIFFTKCKYFVSHPLAKLYNLLISCGVFPGVNPIFKNGDTMNMRNYQPISLVSTIPKSFESLLAKKIVSLINKCIILEQHGFRSSKSTETNLLTFYSYINQVFQSGDQINVIYMDFAKIFEKVDHNIFYNKLFVFRFRDPFLSWLYIFYSNRTQAVK